MDKELRQALNHPITEQSAEEVLDSLKDMMYVLFRRDLYPVESRQIGQFFVQLANPRSAVVSHKIRKKIKRVHKSRPDLIRNIENMVTECFGAESGNYFGYIKPEHQPLVDFLMAYYGAHGVHRMVHFRKPLAFLCLKQRGTPNQVSEFLGVKEDWVHRFIEAVNKNGLDYLKEDERQKNGKQPVYMKLGIIKAVAEEIRKPSPDGFHWKGGHVRSFIMAKFGFQDVPIKRAYEILKEAKNINRTNSD